MPFKHNTYSQLHPKNQLIINYRQINKLIDYKLYLVIIFIIIISKVHHDVTNKSQ